MSRMNRIPAQLITNDNQLKKHVEQKAAEINAIIDANYRNVNYRKDGLNDALLGGSLENQDDSTDTPIEVEKHLRGNAGSVDTDGEIKRAGNLSKEGKNKEAMDKDSTPHMKPR